LSKIFVRFFNFYAMALNNSIVPITNSAALNGPSLRMPTTKRNKLTGVPVPHATDATLMYLFTDGGQYINSKGEKIVYYKCSACRQIYDLARRNGEEKPSLSSAALNVTTGVWATNPMNIDHFCEPKLVDDVRGMAYRNSALNAIANTGGSATEIFRHARVEIVRKYTRRLDEGSYCKFSCKIKSCFRSSCGYSTAVG
jgi:hypothetical protein